MFATGLGQLASQLGTCKPPPVGGAAQALSTSDVLSSLAALLAEQVAPVYSAEESARGGSWQWLGFRGLGV